MIIRGPRERVAGLNQLGPNGWELRLDPMSLQALQRKNPMSLNERAAVSTRKRGVKVTLPAVSFLDTNGGDDD